MIEEFVRAYPPETPRLEFDAGDRSHTEAGSLTGIELPVKLVDFLSATGCGTRGDGLFALVDPRDYLADYSAFFGGDAGGRLPFMLNAFGEVVAYKRVDARQEEISILHTYGPRLEVLAYDFGDFLDRVLLTDDGLRGVINVPLFRQVRAISRRLRPGEAYGFDPALLAGEGEGARADASYFEVVDAREHLRLLFGRAEED